MSELALIVSALSSSVSALLLGGVYRWLRRIDKQTTRNHETLHDTENGPGIVTEVRHNTRALFREGMRSGNTSHHGDD